MRKGVEALDREGQGEEHYYVLRTKDWKAKVYACTTSSAVPDTENRRHCKLLGGRPDLGPVGRTSGVIPP